MGGFNVVDHMNKMRAKSYFAIQPWWVAKDTEDYGHHPKILPQSIAALPIPTSLPKKKQVALKLYSITGKSIGHLYEIILLAENENKATSAAQSSCGVDSDSCKEIEGPFENGHILMMKYVNN